MVGGAEMKSLSLAFVIVITIVFSASCVSKEMPVTETYYETEYSTEYTTETYTETEEVVLSTTKGQTNLTPVSEWHANIYFKAAGEGTGMTYFYGYEIDASSHTESQVKIAISPTAHGAIGVYNLTHLPHSNLLNVSIWDSLNPNLKWSELALADRLNIIVTNPEYTLHFGLIGAGQTKEISFDAKEIKQFAIFVNTPNINSIDNVQLAWSDNITEEKIVTKQRQVPHQVPVQVEKQRTVIKATKVPIWEIWTAATPQEPAATPEPPVELPAPNLATPSVEPPIELPTHQLIYEDDFSDSNSGFDRLIQAEVESDYKNDEYHMIVNKPDWFIWRWNSKTEFFTDFTLDVDATLVSGLNQSRYGVIFRTKDKDNFYYLLISSDGSYTIGERFRGTWLDFQPLTASEYIEKGLSTNQIKVTCKDSTMEVYVNNYNLFTFDDPFNRFTSGYVGMIVYSPENGSNTHVAFDNLKVYVPD
jgi:hypothetical protein